MDNKWIKFLDKTISFVCVSLLASMTILVIASVFLRYLFSISYMWSEELITMLFIGVSFLGCILAVKEKAHIIVDVFLVGLSPTTLKWLNTLTSLANIFVQIVIIDASITWIEATGASPTPGLKIPSYIFYSFMPVSCALIILYEVVSIKTSLHTKKRGDHINEHANIVS